MRVKRGVPWRSYFAKKPHASRRAVIQAPWLLPVAASHLAALCIQKWARGCIVRARLRSGNARRASALRAQKGSRRKSRSGKQLAKYLTALQSKSGSASGDGTEVSSGHQL
eukprot:21470-Heterococcus_DN1.PRE.1